MFDPLYFNSIISPSNFNTKDKDGNNLFIDLCFSCGDDPEGIKYIKYLLKSGCDVNIQNNFGETAIIKVCKHVKYKYKLIKLLLKYNADPNIKDNDGNNAILSACLHFDCFDDIKTIKILLENNADINNEDVEGSNALDNVYERMVFSKKDDIKKIGFQIIDLLTDYGVKNKY